MSERVILDRRREKTVRYRHPWLFSGAIDRVEGDPGDGAVVEVADSHGRTLGRGLYNGRSQIAVRVLSWDPGEVIDEAFWRGRLERSVTARGALAAAQDTDSYRLVHSEADGLPGLIVDRFGEFLVVQLSSLALEKRSEEIIGILAELCLPRGIIHRADREIRDKEGLTLEEVQLFGEAPPADLEILERGVRYRIDLQAGHKTGFYLDQRENRLAGRRWLGRGVVMDAFCYTGAFGIHARLAGAEKVVRVDASADVLDRARSNAELNGLATDGDESIEGNAFELFRRFRDQARSFDGIILDPPKLAPSRSHVKKALRAYKDLNLYALKLLAPGGHLLTFSCSGSVSLRDFQTAVFHASIDAGREVQIVGRLGQGEDHPVRLSFPESDYLKGLVLRAV